MVCGAPASSWVTVSEHTPSRSSWISYVSRVAGSSSQVARQVCTSLTGGSTSSTSPSTGTSTMPACRSSSGATARYRPPGRRSYSARPWYPYLRVHSGLVMASQIACGVALM